MEINLYKTSSIRELADIDVRPLINKVKALSKVDWDTKEDFDFNYNKGNGGALHQVNHITFRFTNKQVEPFKYLISEKWYLWKPILLPIMQKAVERFDYENPTFPKVMLANLPAKSFIVPHKDGGEKGYVPHKIHVPISTNREAFFYLEKKRYHFEVGKAYEVNNGLKHSVVNNGTTDRIHLIFECLDFDVQNEEIKRQLLLAKND